MALPCTVKKGVRHPDTSLGRPALQLSQGPTGTNKEAGPEEDEQCSQHPRLLSTGLIARTASADGWEPSVPCRVQVSRLPQGAGALSDLTDSPGSPAPTIKEL